MVEFNWRSDREKPTFGMSWNGFNVYANDKKSIDEVRRLEHVAGSWKVIEKALRDHIDRQQASELVKHVQLEVAEETEKKLLSALRAAWHELNTIKARDGVAYHRDPPYRGGTPYSTEEHWATVTDNCAEAIEHCTGEPPKPWPFPWETE